ncbi:MAG: acyl-CoA thioesterase/bile acid-CoA:amino acid N-acyltransferase family protein [Planctomycetota bacterium]|jgi:dienelactone hydrolase
MALCAFWLASSAFHAKAEQKSPDIVVEPSDPIVLGDKVHFAAKGLEPGKKVTLKSAMADRLGRIWRAAADFTVPESGVVDPAVLESKGGTYAGIDPWGLFWSMALTHEKQEEKEEGEGRKNVVRLSLHDGDRTLAEREIIRWIRKPGIETVRTKEQGFVSIFFKPSGTKPRPGVVLFGGSEGGIGFTLEAQLLASKGFATMALAYFKEAGLPDHLEKVPLEYCLKAISWMKSQPSVEDSRLAVIGASKGGELALLLASLCKDIKAVVAYVPSSVVFQSIRPGWPRTSSWTLEGKEIPFVPYKYSPEFFRTQKLVILYRNSLTDTEAVKCAIIRVEDTKGPVLLISGKEDTMWPSTEMSDQVLKRLKSKAFPFKHEHLSYDDAGHLIAGPGGLPGRGSNFYGGTVKGVSRARAQGWLRLLEFLAEHLG